MTYYVRVTFFGFSAERFRWSSVRARGGVRKELVFPDEGKRVDRKGLTVTNYRDILSNIVEKRTTKLAYYTY